MIPEILPTCSPYLTPLNPLGLWNHLASYDKSTNPIYVNRLRQEFDSFSFDEDLNVSEGLLTLRRIQANLATLSNPLSDDALKAKLVSAIPESDYWRLIKVLALREDKSLMDTVNLLEPYQKSRASQPAAAKTAHDKKDKDGHKDKSDKSKEKDRRGGYRGRYRGRYRGGYRVSKGRQSGRAKRDQESPDQDDDTKDPRSKHNPKDYTKDRIGHD